MEKYNLIVIGLPQPRAASSGEILASTSALVEKTGVRRAHDTT